MKKPIWEQSRYIFNKLRIKKVVDETRSESRFGFSEAEESKRSEIKEKIFSSKYLKYPINKDTINNQEQKKFDLNVLYSNAVFKKKLETLELKVTIPAQTHQPVTKYVVPGLGEYNSLGEAFMARGLSKNPFAKIYQVEAKVTGITY